MRTLQDWEAGVTLPTAARLQGLIRALLEAGGLSKDVEMSEARELWAAAQREGPRLNAAFDTEWFAGLLASRQASQSIAAAVLTPSDRSTGGAERAQDWGEAPDTTGFVGRVEELELLRYWVLGEHCRLVAVLGMGGIGKTSLAARLAQSVVPSFARVYWRSLRNAPPVREWLAGAVGFLSDQQLVAPASESEQIAALLQVLRARRCLLALDNSETLFEPGQREGRYRAGMDGYGRVMQAVGEASHQSCLIVTSREAPPELTVVGAGARSLELHGLGTAEAQVLLADKQLIGDAEAWARLVERYGGNGLALKIVGETIQQVYASGIDAFVEEVIATYGSVFGGVRRLLDDQAQRLSPLEHDVLTRMAVEREPISLAELTAIMPSGVGRSITIEALETLRRRSLVERAKAGATFTLQAMVLEYVTDRLVETAADEIGRGQPRVLVEQPLIKAQGKDYVRQTQERLIGAPILERLKAQHSEAGVEPRLLTFLSGWRGRPAVEQGYGPGNIVNLLRLLRGNLRGMDLSRLALRQVYLQGVDAQAASLAGADLTESILDAAFDYPTAVAASSDGALLAAGTTTGEVRLWSAPDCTLLVAAPAHTGAIWGLALSEDGRLVASGGGDGLVKLLEAPGGRPLAAWQAHTGEVRAVALAQQGRLVVTSGVDGMVKLWEAPGGQLLTTFHGHRGAVWGVASSGDGRLVASGGGDGTVRLWEPGTGQLLAILKGHTGAVYSVALSDNGRLVASGGGDGTLRLWDAGIGQALATLHGHTGAVSGVALSRDGWLVASGGGDGTLRLWDAGSGQLLTTVHGHNGMVYGVALSGDGRLLASCGGDATVRLSEPGSGQPVATLQGHTGMVYSVALSGDGRLLASGGDAAVRLWDAGSGQPLATLRGHNGLALGVALSKDGRLVASGGVDGTVRLWEARSGQALATLHGHNGLVYGVALSTDGQLLASGGVDGLVQLWEAGNRRLLGSLQGHSGGVRGVAFSGDGRLLASGGGDGTVRLWETESCQLLATVQGHAGAVYCVALSEDGRLVASAGGDGTVQLWEPRSEKPLATLHGHNGLVRGVAFSGDGRLLASGGRDGTVRLWEVATGQLVGTVQGHDGVVYGVALSTDGRLLATGGVDGTLRVWDTDSGACVRTLRRDRHYEGLDITGLTGATKAQRASLVALGAIEQPPAHLVN